MNWKCGRFDIDLAKPKVMGIINMTPDSFSDGGDYSGSLKAGLERAKIHMDAGAELLDVGGESSRPNADFVSVEEEIRRVEPILKELRSWNVPVTLDTRRTEVMRHVLENDLVDGINDIEALRDDGAVELVAGTPDVGVCLMHMKGQPKDMQKSPEYVDVVKEVEDFFEERINACVEAGMRRERIILDPGIGFGKTREHNVALLAKTREIIDKFDLPYLIGVSRKSLIKDVTGELEPKKRLPGSLAIAIHQLRLGARVIRVHDVDATVQAIKMYLALEPELLEA